MHKRLLMILGLCLLLGLLAGCTQEENPAATPIPTLAPTLLPTDQPSEPQDGPTDPDLGTAEPGETGLDDGPEGPLETEPAGTEEPEAAEPTPGPVAANAVITPDPDEAPMQIDPIDRPSPTPMVAIYREYTSTGIGATFDVPRYWSVYSSDSSNVLFQEPQEDAKNGYATQLRITVDSYGTTQNADDADNRLREIMAELANNNWENYFFNDETASRSVAGVSGRYAYFTAEYGGTKLRGRVMVFARNSFLYQVRITCPADYYSGYEEVYRRVLSSWTFL